jgi:hypothetical protein
MPLNILLDGEARGCVHGHRRRARRRVLTGEGLALFQSVARPRDVPRALKPVGVFADPKVLADTVHEAGDGASLLAALFLWPQLLSFASAHPEVTLPLDMAFTAQDADVAIDRDQGRLLLRAR